MKKIALMTWHHAENYGTAYQAYALKTLIEQQGYKVDLIDYHRLNSAPMNVPDISAVISSKFISLCRNIFQKKRRVFEFRKETFGSFYTNKFAYTKECHYNQDFAELNNLYDGFVCGSDQIWGPNWYDGRFFLDFVINARKLISYAPRLGVSKIADREVARQKAYQISRFASLSIRERTGCEIVRNLIGRKDVYNVFDPVIMLDSEHWQKLEEPFVTEGKYALIFFLANNQKNIKISIEAANAKRLKPIVLHCTQTEDTSFANTDELTPEQMLFCIHNAEFVFTDSFHVAVLSIIFHRQLITFQKQLGGNGNTQYKRITDLFERLQITGGIYRGVDSFNQHIDYSKVDTILNKQRGESLAYLASALDRLPGYSENRMELCDISTPCKGIHTDLFNHYLLTVRCKKYREFMITCQFSLVPKCYRCKNLQYTILQNGRQPLFYSKLLEDLQIQDKHVFAKYYRPFYILHKLKKIAHL